MLEDTSVFRRMPTQVIECDPAFYTFLVEHPEVIVNIWSVLKISDVILKRTGENTFHADDRAGTLGQLEFLYRSHDTHVLYGEGHYRRRLSFPSRCAAECLLLLKTAYIRETNGRYYITCRLDAFMHLENVGVELVARNLPTAHRTGRRSQLPRDRRVFWRL